MITKKFYDRLYEFENETDLQLAEVLFLTSKDVYDFENKLEGNNIDFYYSIDEIF